jgi:hypothetical protein
VYESLVTRGLQQRLARLDPDLVERMALDRADAHEVLTRHIAALARRALHAVPGQGAQRLARQVEVAPDSIAPRPVRTTARSVPPSDGCCTSTTRTGCTTCAP